VMFGKAEILVYVARSLGYRAYLNRVKQTDVDLYCVIIHSKFDTENDIKMYTQESDTPTHVMEKFAIRLHNEVGDYYGFEIDGNKRFVLGDFTVTHNTSLVKDGISKILGREFAFIALGGCGDSSFLEGHSYTYEGSTWGKIAQIVIESKCMNPVIYFDELDKVSDTARGQEIIGVLTHLTDTSQNNQFHDKYFSEIELDLSKCLFIFSYNDENLVNPILRDRMYRIRTKGYDLKEKTIIARNYMLPKIREQVGFGPDDIVFSDEVLGHIISNQAKGEEGVRNLKRSLEVIHTKLNLYRLVKSGTQMFSKEMGLNVSFPYTLTKKDVDTLVKVDNAGSSALSMMYL
jgi:ATP-dependent Lon protease